MTLVASISRALEPLVNEAMGEPFKSAWLTDLSQAALTAITEAGYAVVPVEPTEAMLERGCGGIEGNGTFPPSLADSPIDSQWVAEAYCCYRAMISAAQGDG